MSEQSSYHQGKTKDEVADSWVKGLIEEAMSTDPEEALTIQSGYGSTTFRAEQITLAGGGPGADITFLFDGDNDVHEAYFAYYEDGAYVRYLNTYKGQLIWDALQRDPDELRDEEDE